MLVRVNTQVSLPKMLSDVLHQQFGLDAVDGCIDITEENSDIFEVILTEWILSKRGNNQNGYQSRYNGGYRGNQNGYRDNRGGYNQGGNFKKSNNRGFQSDGYKSRDRRDSWNSQGQPNRDRRDNKDGRNDRDNRDGRGDWSNRGGWNNNRYNSYNQSRSYQGSRNQPQGGDRYSARGSDQIRESGESFDEVQGTGRSQGRFGDFERDPYRSRFEQPSQNPGMQDQSYQQSPQGYPQGSGSLQSRFDESLRQLREVTDQRMSTAREEAPRASGEDTSYFRSEPMQSGYQDQQSGYHDQQSVSGMQNSQTQTTQSQSQYQQASPAQSMQSTNFTSVNSTSSTTQGQLDDTPRQEISSEDKAKRRDKLSRVFRK